MFLKTFLMKKKKKSGRGGDVDVLKHHHQAKSSICQNSQSGSLQEGGINLSKLLKAGRYRREASCNSDQQ